MPESKALTLTRHLPVPLDQYRKNALAHEEATQHEEVQRLETYLKRVSDSVKEQIKETKRKEDIAAGVWVATDGQQKKESIMTTPAFNKSIPQYMIKCDECKRVVRWTTDVRESYAGTTCDECRGLIMKIK